MTTWTITSKTSGATLGSYEAATREGALDAMARDAGYKDAADAAETSGDDGAHLIVREVVTAESVTNEQIAALRDESAVAGDRAMVAICRIALGETSEDVGADMALDEAEDAKVCRYEARVDARAECARVIADAEAQS